MAKKCVTVVEIGSSKLSCVVASRGVNGIFNIKAQASVEYAGFYEGEFVDKVGLEDSVRSLFSKVSSIYQKPIEKIYVGVPAEFSKVCEISHQLNFRTRKTIKERDLNDLSKQACEKIDVEDMELLSVSPIWFAIDDGRKTTEPVGLKSTKLMADYSAVLAQTSFIQALNKIWTKIGIEQVEYLSEPLCEAMAVLDKEERERTCIVIDVGARSSSVAFVKGDGMTNLTSFSMGGSFVTRDLSEACSISYEDARNLKKQIVLSLKGGKDDYYNLTLFGGKVVQIPLNYANEAVCYRLELIAQTVNECIRLFAKEFVPYYPVYLCGAGISKIKGGKDFFAKCIGRNVSYGVSKVPAFDKPEIASLMGLVETALSQNE